jgi:hypothetical protein
MERRDFEGSLEMSSIIDIEPIASWVEAHKLDDLIEPKQLGLISRYADDLGINPCIESMKLYGIDYNYFSKASAEDYIALLHDRWIETKHSFQ